MLGAGGVHYHIVCGSDDDVDTSVWGTADDGDNIWWGTRADGDNIVWGTDCGGADCDNIVWGTSDGDNIVWGTALEPTLNIVWGTSGAVDTTMWATSGEDTTLFVPSAADPLLDVAAPFVNLFADPIPVIAPADITPVSPAPIGGLL